jgi:hypothetical protein
MILIKFEDEKKTTIYNSFHSLKFNKSFEHKILNETQQSPNFLKTFHSACLYFYELLYCCLETNLNIFYDCFFFARKKHLRTSLEK